MFYYFARAVPTGSDGSQWDGFKPVSEGGAIIRGKRRLGYRVCKIKFDPGTVVVETRYSTNEKRGTAIL